MTGLRFINSSRVQRVEEVAGWAGVTNDVPVMTKCPRWRLCAATKKGLTGFGCPTNAPSSTYTFLSDLAWRDQSLLLTKVLGPYNNIRAVEAAAVVEGHLATHYSSKGVPSVAC